MKSKRALSLLVVLTVVLASSAFADDIVYTDPATLQIVGTGLDPVQIGSNNVAVFQNQGGATALNTPWLLILGVPNASNPALFSNGSISSVSSSASGATSWSYAGYKTSINGSPAGQDAYTALGYSGITNSESFVNWAGADSTINGITATSFGLYEFNITAVLADKDTVTVDFATLPVGTFVIAYGETSSTSTVTKCKGHPPVCTTTTTTNITQYDTPFTRAGLRTGTPEPASMLLLACGAFGMLGIRKFRQ